MKYASIRNENGQEIAGLEINRVDWERIVRALIEASPSLLHENVELAREIETSIIKFLGED